MTSSCNPTDPQDCTGECDGCRRNPDIRCEREEERAEYLMEKAEAERLYD
jgi:hypothetical protein